MKTVNIIFLHLALLSLLVACGTESQTKAVIDIESLTPVDVKLSRIAENTRVVLLESNNNCMLSANVEYLIGNQYIIAIDDVSTYLFDMNGQFVRKIRTGIDASPGNVSLSKQQSTMLEESDLYVVCKNDTTYLYLLSTGELTGQMSIAQLPNDSRMNNITFEDGSSISINGYRLENIINDGESKVGTRYYTLYNDSKAKAYRIGKYENDFIDFTHNTLEGMNGLDYLPRLSNPYGKLVEIYDARFFLMVSRETLRKPDIKDLVRSRLIYYNSKISEISNPVLVISDLKKHIRL